MPSATTTLKDTIRRDRWFILVGIVLSVALAWVYLIDMALGMSGTTMMMAAATPWAVGTVVSMIIMWAVMMVGMMLPSASPMILIYAKVVRRKRELGRVTAPTSIFVLGYVVVWTVFSIAAGLVQSALQDVALLSPMLVSTSGYLGGGLFVLAGLYQLTPLKNACLRHCRSPMDFVLNHWREGRRGAFFMGLEHGAWCAGCCWAVMVLLFVLGVMNLAWVAALTVLVLVEKVIPGGEWVARGGGIAMLGIGIYLLVVT